MMAERPKHIVDNQRIVYLYRICANGNKYNKMKVRSYLAPWSRVLENLLVTQLTNFSNLRGIQMLIAMFTRVSHRNLNSANRT
jgi:hypothetical protein